MQQDLQEYNQETINKSQHLHQDYDDEQENLTPQQKTYLSGYEQKAQMELENIIMEKIRQMQKQQDSISKQLEVKLDKLLEKITFSDSNSQDRLKFRMHQLALSKILVNTHGKNEFYLVKAHHHLGEAYLEYKCYQQALDHLTISLKKNAKINEMGEIKLYHSYVLTTYSRCYFQISSYDDALEILKKAYDIQLGCFSQNISLDNIQTLKLISNCYLKLKNYPESLSFIDKVLQSLQKTNGKSSKEYARANIQKARILICQQQSIKQAIKTLQDAIHTLDNIKFQNKIQISQYYELLAEFYQKQKDQKKQIQTLYKKYQIYKNQYGQEDQRTLKEKKKIALVMQKYNLLEDAIKEFQQILKYEQKYYPQNKSQIGKTLKSLGVCYLNLNINLTQAQQYLKRAQKILSENGSGKSTRDIKSKLQQIKDKKTQLKEDEDKF